MWPLYLSFSEGVASISGSFSEGGMAFVLVSFSEGDMIILCMLNMVEQTYNKGTRDNTNMLRTSGQKMQQKTIYV